METFQVASDLHIEHGMEDDVDPLSLITPSADTLILAGDIGSLYRFEQLQHFLSVIATHFKIVIYVPGNHEYYRPAGARTLGMPVLESRLRQLDDGIPNLHILDCSSVRIGDICVTGCTLWTRPNVPVPKFIVRIPDMDTDSYRRRHERDVKYIKRMSEYCRNKNLKQLVVTHHCPSLETLKRAKKRKKYLSLYATDLEDLLREEDVKVWVCGHVHSNFDFLSPDRTRVVGNQKGKRKDKITDYSKRFVLTL